MNRELSDNKLHSNMGFSLIEVLVAVAILAAVFGPILKSFTTAAITNSKAQTIQDATSLSEDIMEKVKSTDIETLYNETTGSVPGKIGDTAIDSSKADFYFSNPPALSGTFLKKSPPYRIEYKDITVTQGRTFDVDVNISTDEYANTVAEGDPAIEDASDANSFEVPDLKDIDSSKHLILSWEINSYDPSAIERIVDENAIEKSKRGEISSKAKTDGTKITKIIIEPLGETVNGKNYIKIDSYVSYEIAGYPKAVEYVAYTGTLPEAENAEDEGPNIYLFYSTTIGAGSSDSFKNEEIQIEDNTSGKKHNVYLILQDGLRGFSDSRSTPAIDISLTIKEAGTLVTGLSTLTSNTLDLTSYGAKFYTNAEYGVKPSNMYESIVRDRIYYVTVTVKRNGDTFARLTSTMEAGKEAE